MRVQQVPSSTGNRPFGKTDEAYLGKQSVSSVTKAGEDMASIVVHGEKLIGRPIEIVQSQFADMGHHASTRVHADLEVSNVRPQEGGCRFTGRRRVLGILQEDEIEVLRRADGSSTLRSLSGSNAGLLITQAFEAVGTDRTRVRTTVEMPLNGMLRLLAPLVRIGLQRDLASALEEDRVDLEQRGYPKI